MNQRLLLIFVKHPIPGKVKTRLAEGIGEPTAVAIYKELLTYTLSISQPVDADKVVFYGNQIPPNDLWSDAGFPRYLQEGPTLGERMSRAFEWGFKEGYRNITIIGSDSAQLTTQILEEGFNHLTEYEAVIGPAYDGGYYLLGMNRIIPGVFTDKYWSTDTVFSSTIRDFTLAEISYYLLPTLSDVDTIDDLPGTFLEKWLEDQSISTTKHVSKE